MHALVWFLVGTVAAYLFYLIHKESEATDRMMIELRKQWADEETRLDELPKYLATLPDEEEEEVETREDSIDEAEDD